MRDQSLNYISGFSVFKSAYICAHLRINGFKKTEQAVRAPERVQQVMQKRREWAADAGLDPGTIEKLYRDLIAYFVAEEKQRWRAQ